jgi:hypothetical protein
MIGIVLQALGYIIFGLVVVFFTWRVIRTTPPDARAWYWPFFIISRAGLVTVSIGWGVFKLINAAFGRAISN